MIQLITIKDSHQAAAIHIEGMPDDFLAKFGIRFLEIMHEILLSSSSVIALGAIENNQLVGIIYGTTNTAKVFLEILYKGFFRLLPIVVFKFVTKPNILNNIFQAILYPNKKNEIKSELLILSISKQYRHKGLGTKLIQELIYKFQTNKIKIFKVSTKKSNLIANKFYKKNGGNYQGKIYIFNTIWNLYYFYI